MSSDKILGLDLGTNSVGASIRRGKDFEWFGVTTYKTGVGREKSREFPYAAKRTKHRSSRRRYNARRYRKWETLKVLIENDYCPLTLEELNKWKHYKKGVSRVFPLNNHTFNEWVKLDFNGDGKPDYKSPYQLRAKMINSKYDLNDELSRFKIGRAFYHIAQRRGFKSSRKGGDNERSAVYEGSKDTNATPVNDYLKLLDTHKTLGAAFAYLEDEGTRIRERYTLRKHYKEEIEEICKFQELDDKFKSEVLKAIFFQRPLRSQKGTVGKCTLEPSKARCPVSHPSYEAFRAWQFINNIKYKNDKEGGQQLPKELRDNLFNKKFHLQSKNSIKFEDIRTFIEKNGGKNWKLNYKDNRSVPICPVSARLRSVFGEDWKNFRLKTGKTRCNSKTKSTHDVSYTMDDIWHLLFSFDDEEYFEEFCHKNLNLDKRQVDGLLKLFNEFPVGYANLSLKAINNILPFLEEGMIYTEAVLLAKIPELIGKEEFENNKDFLTKSVKEEIEKNRSQKRIIAITNNLISKYYLGGQPFAIHEFDYKLDDLDKKAIADACEESFGAKTWAHKPETEKQEVLIGVEKEYQAFFNDQSRKHRKPPHLLDQIKAFLSDNDIIKDEELLKKLYHPSQIEIYQKVEPDDDGKVYLPDPSKNNSAFKNPMAMKTLHQLRKKVNYLIKKGMIDEDTRVVVEIAREMNDANKRRAIEKWQRDREAENESFGMAISELIKEPDFEGTANPQSETDIRKFRLWTDQIEDFDGVKEQMNKIESNKNLSASKKDIQKYRLWKEQDCKCMYTGKPISLTNLFDNNLIDFEHTLPRSQSFDNSLKNQTVAYAYYNRNIKKTKLPTELPNYKQNTTEGTAIEPRLEKWKKKIESLEEKIAEQEIKSKYAQSKEKKDDAIRKRHIHEMELGYWKGKVGAFTMEEIPSGFKNSQLRDTQIISKYAFHYLKSVFSKVDVQKGSVTSEFRKIYGIQPKAESKNRTKHHHHAVDAAVLTLIPPASKRQEILKKAYEYEEKNPRKQYHEPPFEGFQANMITKIEEDILINYTSKDQALTPGKKVVRRRGKIQYLKNRKGEFLLDANGKKIPKISTGDSIRGQLHEESFYAKIHRVKLNENNKPLRDKDGNWIYENGDKEFDFAIRKPIEDLKNLKDVVDPMLAKQIENQLNGRTLSKAISEGIYTFDRKGNRVNRIRRIRVWPTPRVNPIEIKKHTYQSKKPHKQHYYAKSGENYAFGLYQSKSGKLELVSVNLFEAIKISKSVDFDKIKDLFEHIIEIGRKKESAELIHVFQPGQKVLFFTQTKEELKELNKSELSKRLYKVKTLYSSTNRNIQFEHHLESRTDEQLQADFSVEKGFKKSAGKHGFSRFRTDFTAPRLLFKPTKEVFIIEGKDFEFMPDGEIKFLF